jgi:hypothetical protein
MQSLPRHASWLACAATSLLLIAPAGAVAAELDVVRLEPASGVFDRRFPFDVPFLVEGVAPAGTARVEAVYEERRSPRDAFSGSTLPATPLVSGVDAERRFRLQMPSVAPGREFRFHLSFERRLASAEATALGAFARGVVDRELDGLTGPEMDAEQAERVRAAVRSAYARALNGGQAPAAPRGALEIRSTEPLLDDAADADAARRSLQRKASELIAAQADLGTALERYRLTTPTLDEDLTIVAESSALQRLLEALEREPAVDPRNPRSPAFLLPEARRVLLASTEEREALAEGRGDPGGSLRIEDARAPEDAEPFQEQQRRNARALRAARVWLRALRGGVLRTVVDGLVAAGELSSADVGRLAALAALNQGALHRGERWAESLEAYARDTQRALRARERALDRIAAALEAEALAAVTLHTVTTEPVASRGGLYVSMDLGVLYPFELERATIYVGANIYFRPVNKQASLAQAGSLGHRLALTLGITLTNMKLEDETRYENLLGERWNLMAGLGLRVTRSLRVGGGAVFFLKNSDNPLVTERSLVASPYVSVSFDLDLAGLIRRAAE